MSTRRALSSGWSATPAITKVSAGRSIPSSSTTSNGYVNFTRRRLRNAGMIGTIFVGNGGSMPPILRQNGSVMAQEFARQQADRQLLDVRENDEWQAGHIDGAQHIPLGQLSARLAEVPKGQRVVAVCRSGSRSAAAVRGLRQQGYDAENL